MSDDEKIKLRNDIQNIVTMITHSYTEDADSGFARNSEPNRKIERSYRRSPETDKNGTPPYF